MCVCISISAHRKASKVLAATLGSVVRSKVSKDSLWTPEATEAYIRTQWMKAKSESEEAGVMRDSDDHMEDLDHAEESHFEGEAKRMSLREVLSLSSSSPLQWHSLSLCLSYLSSLKLADACISAHTFHSYDPLLSLGAVVLDCQTLRNLSVLEIGRVCDCVCVCVCECLCVCVRWSENVGGRERAESECLFRGRVTRQWDVFASLFGSYTDLSGHPPPPQMAVSSPAQYW